MTALSDAGKWQQALQTFDERPEAVRLNEPLVHAAICAAAAGQQWQRALSLLAELKEQRLVSAAGWQKPPRTLPCLPS